MLFAETTGDTAWQIVVAGLLGGFLTKATDYVLTFIREQRKDRKENADAARQARREDESEAISRMEAMLDRVERQLAAEKRDNSRYQELANRATVRAERAVIWIKHLESRLRDAGIQFDPWTEDGESKTVYRPPGPGQGDAETDVGADGGYQ